MCESPTPATQIQAPKARSLTAIRFDTHCGRPPRVRESLTQAKQIQAPRGKRREEEEGGGEEGGGRQRPECNSKRVPNHRRVGKKHTKNLQLPKNGPIPIKINGSEWKSDVLGVKESFGSTPGA